MAGFPIQWVSDSMGSPPSGKGGVEFSVRGASDPDTAPLGDHLGLRGQEALRRERERGGWMVLNSIVSLL